MKNANQRVKSCCEDKKELSATIVVFFWLIIIFKKKEKMLKEQKIMRENYSLRLRIHYKVIINLLVF